MRSTAESKPIISRHAGCFRCMEWSSVVRAGAGRDCVTHKSCYAKLRCFANFLRDGSQRLQGRHLFVNTSSHFGANQQPPPGGRVRPERRADDVRLRRVVRAAVRHVVELLSGEMAGHSGQEIGSLNAWVLP